MSTEVSEDAESEVYEQFIRQVTRLSNVSNAADVLQWDQEIVMPEGGTPARSQQLAALSAVKHDLLTDETMGTYLEALRGSELEAEQQAVVREVGRLYDRQTSVPESLVQEISQTTSEAHPVWKSAKENDEFSEFAPTLERLVELKREYAAHIDPDADPYAVLFAEYEPYIDLETADQVLTRLREELVPLIEEIETSEVELATEAVSGTFAEETQETFVRQVLDELGYDWEHGRLDTAPHPFSSGNTYDARVSTRFDESALLGALMSTIHEFGHATYTLGLPEEHYGTPLGESRNLSVHESQSRFWENHIGRSRPFWERILPTIHERFPQLEDLTAEEAYQAANQVYEDNLIRVEADELTYHLHIVIRYEIERALINGELDVEEVPQVWNDKYEEYLGVRPQSDAEGCLQDIHWSHGSFGYFPTYSLGSVMAAQIDAAVRRDLDLDELVRTGEFEPVHDWLTENVHQHGCRYTTNDLIEQATGESFSADDFLDYIDHKYSELYDL